MNVLDGSRGVEPGLSAHGLGCDTLVGHVLPLSRYEVCENTEAQKPGADRWVEYLNRSYQCGGHSLLQLFAEVELIPVGWLKDLNCWCCDITHSQDVAP